VFLCLSSLFPHRAMVNRSPLDVFFTLFFSSRRGALTLYSSREDVNGTPVVPAPVTFFLFIPILLSFLSFRYPLFLLIIPIQTLVPFECTFQSFPPPPTPPVHGFYWLLPPVSYPTPPFYFFRSPPYCCREAGPWITLPFLSYTGNSANVRIDTDFDSFPSLFP